jgi:hypothetical protein
MSDALCATTFLGSCYSLRWSNIGLLVPHLLPPPLLRVVIDIKNFY